VIVGVTPLAVACSGPPDRGGCGGEGAISGNRYDVTK